MRCAPFLLPLLCCTHGAAQSLNFTKDDQLAMIPYQKLLDVRQLTLEAWIKVEPNERYYSYVLSRNYGDMGYGIALHGRPEKVFSQAPDMKVPMGRWIHVAVVASDKAQKFYVDGELASAGGRSGFLKPIEQALLIGNSYFHGSPGGELTSFRGCIDEVRIWSKPRTQAEIKRTMHRYLRGNERGLLGYFPFNKKDGQIVRDYTGRLISGSLGRSFQPDPADPSWAEGVKLSGAMPRPRGRR